MKKRALKIGDKTARLPLIQGGMGVGISLGRLAGTVAKEGGVGLISTAQIGFLEPDFDKNPIEANLRAIEKELKKAREIAGDGIVGFNIMVATRDYERYVKKAVEIGADIIVSGAGLPTELPAYAGEGKTALAPIVSTEKSAKVILKFWDKKYQRVPDLLVIEGPHAGGHLGFSKGQIDFYEEPGTYEEEVKKIICIVRGYEEKYAREIPVALAGGISNSADVRAAFELGADAVQVATRFVTTKECDADIRYKEAYINAKKEDIIIVKSPVGMPGRAIKNTFMEKVMREEKIAHGCHQCLKHCNPATIPYCITDALIHAAKGEVEEALLFCGADAYKAERIETVKEVVDSLFD